MKVIDYLWLLTTRPSEAYARIEGILDSRIQPWLRSRPKYDPIALSELVCHLSSLLDFGQEFEAIWQERELQEIEEAVVRGIRSLPPDAPFGSFQNGDLLLGRICYAMCRMLRPKHVVETGVCYGVTSSYVLKALACNEHGTLHSIDLPPLGRGGDSFVGRLVPHELRNRWDFQRGASRFLLPSVLKQVGKVDLFIHDSLHTYRNMFREFDQVTCSLSVPGVVISDDIEGNSAFEDWVARTSPKFSAVVKEERKCSCFGIAVFAGEQTTDRKRLEQISNV